MGRKNRYNFARWVYPDYVILIRYWDRYIVYDNDILICNYIEFYKKNKYRFYVFDKYRINYLVLDELDIVRIESYDENNYCKYKYLTNIRRIVKKIGNNLIKD